MTKASDALIAWLEAEQAQPKSASYPEHADLAGFRLLTPEQRAAYVAAIQTYFAPVAATARRFIVKGLGVAKRNVELEEAALAAWSSSWDEDLSLGNRFVEVALADGHGWEAARLVNKIGQYDAFPGLMKKLDVVVDDFGDERAAELMAQAMDGENLFFSDGIQAWTFAAMIAATARDDLLSAIARQADAWLWVPDNPSWPRKEGFARRLSEVVAKYAKTDAARALAADIASRVAEAEGAS